MSYSIINSVELIPFIEEAIESVKSEERARIKKASDDDDDDFKSMTISCIKSNFAKDKNLLFNLLKLAKTNEVVHLSADDAGMIYDCSESFKNRLNKGYR